MFYKELRDYILSDKIDQILKRLTCNDDIKDEKDRYVLLLDEAYKLYGDGDYHFISSPGRSEIGGNHTDHQHGHVVAASLNIDNLLVVKSNDSNTVNYKDGSFVIKPVDLNNLDIIEEEKNTSESLIRGMASRIKQLGYQIGGLDCLCNSKVLVGSGISSSACFEIMMIEAFNFIYNNDSINPIERAKIGQYAENVYFGKPSGLLDQSAISVGGFVAIDFKDAKNPIVENHDFSFNDYGYELILVDTKGDHSDLSDEYAAITSEIKQVANCLNVEYLADSNIQELMNNLTSIRKTINNDRAILRSIHFYNEDDRAIKLKQAIINKDINSILDLMNQSGRSSFEYLQNVYPASRPNSQSLALGLAIADMYLKQVGAFRVHGGGFEGTIQAIVPNDKVDGFKKAMNLVFGDDCILQVRIRPVGTCTVI